MKWQTFKGKTCTFETIDHQHMSNCYWFSRIVGGLASNHSHLQEIKHMLEERFNGQLLPYRPHVQFEYEIDYLKDHGHIKPHRQYPVDTMVLGANGHEHTYNIDHSKFDIWFEGNCVGEIIMTQ
jgi:hypothetical protein